MNFSDVNQSFIGSHLIQTLLDNDEDDLIFPIPIHNINPFLIKDLNCGNVTPNNINKIIQLLDYLLVDNTIKYIYMHAKPNDEKYILNEYNSINHKLPHIINEPFSTDTETMCAWGLLNFLKYAHENGCAWDTDTCSKSAENGHIACLKYAHENNCAWNTDTCSKASENGHIACLKYAHERNCNWTSKTCYNAAVCGHIDCLKYAHENGCTWSSDTYEDTERNNQMECLKYARDHNCPRPRVPTMFF